MPEKYLIVSLGSIGRRHLANLRQLCPDAQIAVLRLHTALSPTNLPVGADVQFSSMQEAIAFTPKAAVVAGPATTHLEVAMALGAARIPMLIEKPIAHTTSGLTPLLVVCAESNVPLMIGYNLRFLPSLRECKRLLDSGAIGQVRGVRAEVGQYLPDWRPETRYQETVSAQKALGGGALLELSHEIDYLYWMFGIPDRVCAMGGRYSELETDVEDMVEFCLDYENPGRLINIHLDFLQRTPTRSCKFIGDKGTLVWNGITDRIELFCIDNGVWQPINAFVQTDRNQMYLDELRHFLDCARGQLPPMCTGVAGYDVLAIVEAAKIAMQNGSTVRVSGYSGV